MKLYNLFLVVVFAVLTSFACKSNDKGEESYELVLIDSFTLEPLNTVNVNSLCAKYYKDGEDEYLFWGNRPQNSIEVFDLLSGRHFKSIKFPREGPNSISRISGGFTVLNMDSIFISNLELGRIYLFDSTGTLKNIFNHTDTNYLSANNLLNLNSKIHSDIYRNQGKLVFPLRISYFPIIPSDSIVYDMQVVKLYDLKKQSFTNSGLHFKPDVYQPLSLFIENSTAMLDNRFYYQVATKSRIKYTDDFHTESIREVNSRFQTNYVKMNDYPTDILEYTAREFSYRSLLADRFNNNLYRIIKLPVNDILNADLEKEIENVFERMSVMVLSKDLKILGEYLFDHSNYSWNECFVGEKGLYLLRSPYHANYFEPRITYDIYKFKLKDGNFLQ